MSMFRSFHRLTLRQFPFLVNAGSRLVLRMKCGARYPWLSMAGLPWFVCLIFEGVGEIGSWRLLHKRIRGRCPERRSGNPVGWRNHTQCVTVRTERSRSCTRPNRLKYSCALGNLLGKQNGNQ